MKTLVIFFFAIFSFQTFFQCHGIFFKKNRTEENSLIRYCLQSKTPFHDLINNCQGTNLSQRSTRKKLEWVIKEMTRSRDINNLDVRGESALKLIQGIKKENKDHTAEECNFLIRLLKKNGAEEITTLYLPKIYDWESLENVIVRTKIVDLLLAYSKSNSLIRIIFPNHSIQEIKGQAEKDYFLWRYLQENPKIVSLLAKTDSADLNASLKRVF